MANGSGAAGALIGGLFGLAGGLIGGYERKKAQTKFRRRQRAAIGAARQFADERIQQLLGSPLLRQGMEFLEGTFARPEDSPLADQLRKSLRVAQESRGLRRSVAGAVGEARALGAFTQNLRASLLPEVARFGTLPEQLRQSIIGFETPLRVAAATGAPVPGIQANPEQLFGGFLGSSLGQAAAGAAGGFQIGSALSFQQQMLQQQQRSAQQQQELIDAIRTSRASSGFSSFTGAGTPFAQLGY